VDLWKTFKTSPELMEARFKEWPAISHFACELFGHSSFDEKTMERLLHWLQAAHGVVDVLGIQRSQVVLLLREAVTEAVRGGEGANPDEGGVGGREGEAARRNSDQGATEQAEGDDRNCDEGDRALSEELAPSPSPLQLDILDALRALRATDSERRKTGREIARRVGGDVTDQSVKAPLADLKCRELVDSRTGRNGGTWLTPGGLNCINTLRPKR
jgi:hypothetical protein